MCIVYGQASAPWWLCWGELILSSSPPESERTALRCAPRLVCNLDFLASHLTPPPTLRLPPMPISRPQIRGSVSLSFGLRKIGPLHGNVGKSCALFGTDLPRLEPDFA